MPPHHVRTVGERRGTHHVRNVAEMCSGSEAGSYLRLIDFVYHSTLGVRVIKKMKKNVGECLTTYGSSARAQPCDCLESDSLEFRLLSRSRLS